MLDTIVDKAWNCFNRISNAADKKPPDHPKKKSSKNINVEDDLHGSKTFDWICRPERSATFTAGDISKLSNFAENMPNPEKLDSAFIELLEELDLPPEKQKELQNQTSEKKWQMICEQANRQQADPTKIISKLSEFAVQFPERDDWRRLSSRLESLSIFLRTTSFSFVQDFLEMGGVDLLVSLLNQAREKDAVTIGIPILSAFRTLLNSTAARTTILKNKAALLSIAAALDFNHPRSKILALEILSGLCLASEEGHGSVLGALTDAQKILGERTRFQRIIDDLHRSHGDCLRDSQRVRVALMSLVNALLRSGPAEKSLEFRCHLRYELLMLGIQEVIDGLRQTNGTILEDHFDLFEMLRQEDEQELTSGSDSGASSPSLPETPMEMTRILEKRLATTKALPHLKSLLQHLLMIPTNEKTDTLWKLFDIILQQLSLQTSMMDFEVEMDSQFKEAPMKFNMDSLLTKLKTHVECERLESEREKLQKELDNERRKNVELENRISDLQESDGFSMKSFLRGSDTSSNPSDPCPSPMPSVLSSIPECRPPPCVPPPPPPPSAALLKSGGGINLAPKKNVPKPPHPMKVLNWKVLPTSKVPGTIFENIGEESMYKIINLDNVAAMFASGKDHDDKASTSGTLRRRQESAAISVLESRRAQNCNIMLSKLKLSHREIRLAVLSMDENNRIPKDMIEQMLKYIPTSDELLLVDEIVEKHKSPQVLALADRYFYEVGKIPRFEQRLRCLNAIRSFQERIEAVALYTNAVLKASDSVSSSKKLKQFVSLVLALGNYLNHSKHNGNASGFMVESFRALSDVRSNFKHEQNLLHFIFETIEQKLPEVLKMRKELTSVFEAVKFSRTEMETELKAIQETLRELETELHTQKSKPKTSASTSSIIDPVTQPADASKSDTKLLRYKDDKFIEVVEAFLSTARKQLSEIQTSNDNMVKKFSSCASYFGEDASKSSPDEFFGHFTLLLNKLHECQTAILEAREEEERQKRQTLAKSILNARKGLNSSVHHAGGSAGHIRRSRVNNPKDSRDFERLIDAIQSGDIFSDELTRLRTSFRFPKKSIRRPS